jgi:superfamily II DNA or RNA helicase
MRSIKKGDNMPFIDNETQTMVQALSNALQTSDKVDICVGYFYLSGFESLSAQLENKKIRILIGLEIDPTLIPEIAQQSKENDIDFSRYQFRAPTGSSIKLRKNYIDGLIGFINDSDTFDSAETDAALDLFIRKIEDGSLEIRKTVKDYHGKFYILTNCEDFSQNGDYLGTVFSGSSNFTYKGLVGQGELNDSYRDKAKYLDYLSLFNRMWQESSISIVEQSNKHQFLAEIKSKVWKYSLPSPYEIYLRVLHELYSRETESSVLTPSKITSGLYNDFEYQIDAIKMGIDRLNRYDGVIVADVVGLGKSIIAAAIARNYDEMQTVVITPRHLISQWEEYQLQFAIRGPRIMSSGNIPAVYKIFNVTSNPLLIIIDEAHRFRNEDTNDYKMLHQICRSHPLNKIVLLTATPFNNAPKDVFALVKLFQIPGKTTIRSVDNLSIRFRELIDRYKRLRRAVTQNNETMDIEKETAQIAAEQRRLIENIVIRRSRLDLMNISRYREDLERQNISFPTVNGPTLLQYDLGMLFDLYLNTLNKIVGTSNTGLTGARYQPTRYGINSRLFKEKFGTSVLESDLKVAQMNLAVLMKRLLVMRFESSKYAFQLTLNKMIVTNEIIENWWNHYGGVPILKKGTLVDPLDYLDEDGQFTNAFDEDIDYLQSNSGLMILPKEMIERPEDFINDLHSDTILLKEINNEWFGPNSQIINYDPKAEELDRVISSLLIEDPTRKIVVFSSYADTVNYVYERLNSYDNYRLIKYTSSDSKLIKEKVRMNFDASLALEKQENDFDVLIATDALSEGINLHRAGVVINYDIPYNPTRVIQRVGRINRINKKVFDNIFVFNFFPTLIGEQETKIKMISTLKLNLINSIIGSDTKHLTQDEEIKSFFVSEFEFAQSEEDQESWDTVHRENYDNAKNDKDLIAKIEDLPRRTRIQRKSNNKSYTLAYGKKGEESIFAYCERNSETELVSTEQALPYFYANQVEIADHVDNYFHEILSKIKDKLFSKSPMPSIQGRRAEAIKTLQFIKNLNSNSETYCIDLIKIIREYDDISDGTLRDIAQIDLQKTEKLFENLINIVPIKIIENILERAEKTEVGHELILFVEDFKHGT